MNIFWLFFASFRIIPRDYSFYSQNSAVNRQVNEWTSKGWTIHQVFDKVANANPEKPAVRFGDETWNFKQLQEYSLRVANYFLSKKFKKGDVMAVLMSNGPSYVGLWLGLSRIGVVAVLIDTSKMLTSYEISLSEFHDGVVLGQEPEGLIVSTEFDSVLQHTEFQTKYSIPTKTRKFLVAKEKPSKIRGKGVEYVDLSIEAASPRPIDETIVKSLDMSSTMVNIHNYGVGNSFKKTSIDFKRFVFMSTAINKMLKIRPDDVLYNPEPIYQSYVSFVGTGQMLLFGTTMVIKPNFSRKDYFSDCKQFDVTVAQYGGWMIKHLYYMEPSDKDRDHKVRMMLGSGMPQILWNDVQKRFNVKQIGEFHGSLNGNPYLINVDNKEGVSGFVPWFVKGIHPVDLIDFERGTGVPLRDKDGFCIRTKSKGLLIGVIESGAETSKSENTDGKTKQFSIIENVFKKGDKYFVSENIFEMDDYGYFYFVDSVKNIFRWRGEDFSISQVANIIVKEFSFEPMNVIVYGVKVGAADGRACMVTFAAIENEKLDKAHLMRAFRSVLSSNQTPKFLRITNELPRDEFLGVDRLALEKYGINPSAWKKSDVLYYYNENENKPYYEHLTEDVFKSIEAGNTLI